MNLFQIQQKRHFLLVLPVLALPFLCLVFYSLGGGQGNPKEKSVLTNGLNVQLPSPVLDPARAFENKLKAYQQADNDSARKAQFQRQDPYHHDSTAGIPRPDVSIHPAASPGTGSPTPPAPDARATQLLRQLDHLRQSLHATPAQAKPPAPSPSPSLPADESAAEPDPRIHQLNTLLDKVIRIQHAQEPPAAPAISLQPAHAGENVLPADTTVNSITAIIPTDQTLTAGGTLALRITDSLRVAGNPIPSGQLVYGIVSFNNDRLLIHITTLRVDRNLYPADWQVYDLDGLPGIHIPSLLGRDVAKQSADEAVNSVNLLTTDGGLPAQAAGAGIQAAKSFLGHKVRQVRVTVNAGYLVLLHSPQAHSPRRFAADATPAKLPDPPGLEPGTTTLAQAHDGGLRVVLRRLMIKDSCLWIDLEWSNHSAISFSPAYARWYIRPHKQVKRTASQEQAVNPLVSTAPSFIAADSTVQSWFGFRPFALAKGTRLQFETGETGGGRVLTLIIHRDQLLKATTYATIREKDPDQAAPGLLQ